MLQSFTLAAALLRGFGAAPEWSAPQNPPAAPVTLNMSFEVLADPEAIARPTYAGDVDYTSWNNVFVKPVGEPSPFFTSLKESFTFIRKAAAEVGIDTNGDGVGDVPVPLTGNITPVRTRIGKGEGERDWAVLTVSAMDKDRYQGIETDLSLRTEGGPIYIAPAASMVGSLGTTQIRVIDDNLDGICGSYGLSWGFIGVREGEFQPEVDSIVIGNSKHARPWSAHQQIDGKWYKVESLDFGRKLRLTQIPMETGFLKLDYKGPPLSYLIVKGKDKDNSTDFFDLSEGGSKGVEVPTGTYELHYGIARQGKRREVQKCAVLPTKECDTVIVNAGKTEVFKLGAPFSFEFEAHDDGDSVTLVGKTVGVVGCGAERYARVWGAAPHPEVSIRKKGTKKAEKTEKTTWVSDRDLLAKGWDYTWFPFDLNLKKKLAEDAQEMQLHEKKNKLFGEVSSPWKEVQ